MDESRDPEPPAPGREVDPLLAKLAAERFDVAVHMCGGGWSANPFIGRLGAAVTAGSRAADAPAAGRWVPFRPFQPEVLRLLEVVSAIGAVPVTVEPRVPVTNTDRAAAAAVFPGDDRPLVLLHPGASDSSRWWPAERFGAVGAELARRGARVVVTGTDAERDLAARVLAALGGGESVCGRLSLAGLIGLLDRAALLVSNDSGPVHLGAAVGTATVGIYRAIHAMTSRPPTHARHRVLISWQMACPTCGSDSLRDDCDHAPSFVEDVSTAAVTAEATELFELERRRGPAAAMQVAPGRRAGSPHPESRRAPTRRTP
jgi:ADP-heptose:LPS heptosyltransferase